MTRLLPLLVAAGVNAQPYLNLDFETSTRGMPWYWYTTGAGYSFALDSTTFESGVQSLHIQSVTAASTGLGVASQLFPIDLVRGKHVSVSGWIKTSNVHGYAAIWWRVDGANAVLSLDNMSQTGPRGTTDWTPYSFERDVSGDAVDVVFGVFLAGTGDAWFDNLQVQIDGVPFQQGPPPYIGEPTPAQLNWVTSTAIPLTGASTAISGPITPPILCPKINTLSASTNSDDLSALSAWRYPSSSASKSRRALGP